MTDDEPTPAEITRSLLNCMEMLREAAAVASEHSTDEDVRVPISPRAARSIAYVMQIAAIHIGRQIPDPDDPDED